MYFRLTSIVLVIVGLISATSFASAVPVQVTAFGSVGFNLIQGQLAGVQSGAPVTLSFQVDSNDFIDGPNFPVRGYAIDLSTFELNVGGVTVPVIDPQPFGTPYFVLRDNDPAVDGIYLTRGGVEFPAPLAVTIPGLTPQHELSLARSFNVGTAFDSLDILDAVGSYGTEDIGSFLFTLGRFGNAGLESSVDGFTITVVPEPTSLSLLAAAVVVLACRRR